MEDQGLIAARESSLQVLILLPTPRKVLGRLQVFPGDCWGGCCAPEAEGYRDTLWTHRGDPVNILALCVLHL